MLALAIASATLDSWPTSPVWTGIGLVATVLGCALGVASVWLTVLIYRWTGRDDEKRHAELAERLAEQKDALELMGTLIRDLKPTPPNLGTVLRQLSQQERNQLNGLLDPGEQIVGLARSGSGKGNHPWQAVTTAGRTLQVWTGARGGRVHTKVL